MYSLLGKVKLKLVSNCSLYVDATVPSTISDLNAIYEKLIKNVHYCLFGYKKKCVCAIVWLMKLLMRIVCNPSANRQMP